MQGSNHADRAEGTGLRILQPNQWHPGIYQVEGVGLFPTQMVATGELQPETHAVLRILSRRVSRRDIDIFLKIAVKMKNPGDAARIDAVLQVSASANRALYQELYEEGSEMRQVLREIMEEDFKKAEARGEARGEIKGIYKTLAGLVKDKLITEAEAARRAGVTVAEFRKNVKLSTL